MEALIIERIAGVGRQLVTACAADDTNERCELATPDRRGDSPAGRPLSRVPPDPSPGSRPDVVNRKCSADRRMINGGGRK